MVDEINIDVVCDRNVSRFGYHDASSCEKEADVQRAQSAVQYGRDEGESAIFDGTSGTSHSATLICFCVV